MDRTNILFIVFFTILMLSSAFFYMFYFKASNNKIFKSKSPTIYSYNGIKLNPENAPELTNLFENVDNKGPHKVFKSSLDCLKCHAIGVEINGSIKAPRIAHNTELKDVYDLNYCISCHKLASNE